MTLIPENYASDREICYCGLAIHFDPGIGAWIHTRARARYCTDGEEVATPRP